MNDIIVILILVLLGGIALYSCFRKKNRGCGGNCGGCSGCGGCGGSCHNCEHCHDDGDNDRPKPQA